MAKQKQDILDRLVASLSVRGFLLHPATLFVTAAVAMISVTIIAWQQNQNEIMSLDEFRLTPEMIQITPQPDWIDEDLTALILLESGERSPSILDTQLVRRTANIMKKAGFVEHVRSVQKSKNGLSIDL